MKGILWLASYPKSGNTWMRAFLANLQADAETPVDINRLHHAQFASREFWDQMSGWETAELTVGERQEMRFAVQEAFAAQDRDVPVKTHELFADPLDGMARFSRAATRGVIYVVRNPLDVAVSLSHFNRQSLDAAIAFMGDARATLPGAPGSTQEAQLLGDWSAHVASWTEAPWLPVCVLRYEDMLAKQEETFRLAAEAAGASSDPARIARAVARSGFAELQRQERERGFIEGHADRSFFRAGRSGSWRERLTASHVGEIVRRHGATMRRFGYLDDDGQPRE